MRRFFASGLRRRLGGAFSLSPRLLVGLSLLAAAACLTLLYVRFSMVERVRKEEDDGRLTTIDLRPDRVVAGAESGDRVTIVEGLREGELVVTSAQFLLDSEANLDAGLERLDAEPGEAAPAPAAPATPDPHAAREFAGAGQGLREPPVDEHEFRNGVGQSVRFLRDERGKVIGNVIVKP